MGETVRGAIEATTIPTDSTSGWYFISRVDPFVNRNDDAYGCLFGSSKNHAGFDPIAPERGIPDDVSHDVRERYDSDEEYAFGESHVSLAELQAVDWSERPEQALEVWYRPDDGGHWRRFERRETLSKTERERLAAGKRVSWTDEQGEWELKGNVLTRESVCREAGWWWVTHELMARLTEWGYEPDCVRLVAWCAW